MIMKTIIKNTLVLALMVFASASYATVSDTHIRARGEKQFSVYHNATGEFHFAVKDQFGKVVYSINGNKKNKFVKTFDVRNLPNGSYILEAKDADVVSRYALQITSDGLEINKNMPLTSAR
jgi:hypothetical protein